MPDSDEKSEPEKKVSQEITASEPEEKEKSPTAPVETKSDEPPSEPKSDKTSENGENKDPSDKSETKSDREDAAPVLSEKKDEKKKVPVALPVLPIGEKPQVKVENSRNNNNAFTADLNKAPATVYVRSTFTNPGFDYWRRKNPVADKVFITDVTVDLNTVTIRECATEKGFFRERQNCSENDLKQ